MAHVLLGRRQCPTAWWPRQICYHTTHPNEICQVASEYGTPRDKFRKRVSSRDKFWCQAACTVPEQTPNSGTPLVSVTVSPSSR